jgi:hypothetical protein
MFKNCYALGRRRLRSRLFSIALLYFHYPLEKIQTMRKLLTGSLCLLAALLLTGCKPSLDGSSEEAFQTSFRNMVLTIESPKLLLQFRDDFIVVNRAFRAEAERERKTTGEEFGALMLKKFDGLTADDIRETAADLRLKYEADPSLKPKTLLDQYK